MPKLNLRQARFVTEYMIDLNASAAATRAGYSARSSHTVGGRLLRRPEVAAALAERQQALLAKVELTAELVLRQTMRIAFADIGRLYNADGTLKDMPDVDSDTRAAVAWVTSEERNAGRVRRVRMKDSIAALTLLGRHLRLWRDKDDGAVDGPGIIRGLAEGEAWARAQGR